MNSVGSKGCTSANSHKHREVVDTSGTWETDGPAMAKRPCTWSRRSDLTGDLSSIIDTGVVKSGQRQRVALKLGE